MKDLLFIKSIMKNLLLSLLIILTNLIFAQNGIYSTDFVSDPINLNIETQDLGRYTLTGAENSSGQYQGFFSAHNGNESVTSRIINIDQSETIISDQVLLPSGNTAITGIYVANSGHYKPFILEVDPNGNPIKSMGYNGLVHQETETHKIIYSEELNMIFICGATRIYNPFLSAFSTDQWAFVMAVDPTSLGVIWCSFMDSGQSTNNGQDFDLADDLAIVREETGAHFIAVTGSINQPGSGSQLLMSALLDPDNGNSFYTNGLHFGSHAAGASILQIYDNQYWILANTSSGMALLCIDVPTGNVNGTAKYINGLFPGNQVLRGYELDGRFDVAEATIGGYINDQTANPAPNPKIAPFQIKVNLDLCSEIVLAQDGTFFQANNVFENSQGAYAEFVGPDYVNTPDIIISQDVDFTRLIGFRGNRYDIASTDPSGHCISNCETPFIVSASDFNPTVLYQSAFTPQFIYTVPAKGHSVPRNEDIASDFQATTMNCPLTCPVQVHQICPTDFQLSINCINKCYGPPRYQWIIPTLTIDDPNSSTPIVSTAYGGTHEYTLILTYMVNGVSHTCTFTGNITLPAVFCNNLTFNINVSPTGYCNEYLIDISDNASGCLDITYAVYIEQLQSPYCNVWTAQQITGPTTFDISNCETGLYRIYATAYVSYNGVPLQNCFTGFTYHQLTNYNITPRISVGQAMIGQGLCNPGSRGYIEIDITNFPNFPSPSSCYDIYWNNILGSTSYSCCFDGSGNCNQISLYIVDNCEGCTYYDNNVYSGPNILEESGGIIQEFEIINSTEPDLIDFFPNPAFNQLNIKLNTDEPNFLINIYDIDGKLWLRAGLSEQTDTLDISRLPSGTFIIEAYDISTGRKEISRFIKI